MPSCGVRPSIRLFRCPWRSCILSKRVNISFTSSIFFHRRVAIPFWFFIPNGIVIFRRRPRNWDKNRSWNSHMLCPSFRNAPIWIKTAQHIVIVFLPYGSPIILVLSAPKISRDSDGVTPCGGAKYRWGIKISRFSTKKSLSRNRYKIAP